MFTALLRVFRLCILTLTVFFSCSSAIATERVVLNEKEFTYDTVEQLKQRCSQIIANFDSSIKTKKAAAGSSWNPFRAMAQRKLETLLANRKAFLLTNIVAPSSNLACDKCHGSKMIICGSCNESGTEMCQRCKGSRKEAKWYGTIPCTLCDARGTVRCVTCSGSRKVRCPDCQATGSRIRPAHKLTVSELLDVKDSD